MSDKPNPPLGELLSGMSLGPAWAKPSVGGKPSFDIGKFPADKGRERRNDKRDFQDRRGKPRDDRRGERAERPPRAEVLPAPGITVSLVPSVESIRLIAKEIQQEARVYPLFHVSKTLLAERSRCHAVFEVPEPQPLLWRGLHEEAVFLTREEALQHLWRSKLRQEQVEEQTVENEPPKGNFTAVARCGMSGVWLGPPNFHGYQVKLRQLHRDRFAHVAFESYAAKVRVEKGEDAINEWLATMSKATRWRLRGQDDEAWTQDESQIKRTFAETFFDEAFEEARCVEVNAAIPPTHLSPSLMASMKQAGNHARNHPAFLIPAICKILDAEHLPLFKRQGKLYTGPAKPKPVAADQVFAQRPGIMVDWIRANTPAKLEGLWKAVSPEGNGTPPAEFAADLYWLLQQGHILLFPDDTLVVQEFRVPTPPPAPKKAKQKQEPAKETTHEAEAAPAAAAGDPVEESVPDGDPTAIEEASPELVTPTESAETPKEDSSPLGIDDSPPV